MTALSHAIYGSTTWDDIIDGDDCFLEVTGKSMTCDDKGVWIRDPGAPQLNWHPNSELDAPFAHDPRTTPNLPFRFSAAHLAAFMLDGVGAFIQERFGPMGGIPDEDELNAFPPEALTAKHAIESAYQAYHEALAAVGPLNPSHNLRVKELSAIEKTARQEARAKLGFKKMASSSKYKEAVAATRQASSDADTAHAKWRKKMVQHLLSSEGNSNSAAVTAHVTPKQRPAGASAAPMCATLKEASDWLAVYGVIRSPKQIIEDGAKGLVTIWAGLPDGTYIRSAEPYTLPPEEAALFIAAGIPSPAVALAFSERPAEKTEMVQLSPNDCLQFLQINEAHIRGDGFADGATMPDVLNEFSKVLTVRHVDALRVLGDGLSQYAAADKAPSTANESLTDRAEQDQSGTPQGGRPRVAWRVFIEENLDSCVAAQERGGPRGLIKFMHEHGRSHRIHENKSAHDTIIYETEMGDRTTVKKKTIQTAISELKRSRR